MGLATMNSSLALPPMAPMSARTSIVERPQRRKKRL